MVVWGRIFKRTFIFFTAGFLINFMAASGHIEDTLIMGYVYRYGIQPLMQHNPNKEINFFI
jgi:hypothetical protein